MKITKFGHSCMLIEEAGVRILIDPGSYSSAQNTVRDLDAILITHKHGDHCDVDSIKALALNSPKVKKYANSEVVEMLKENGIDSEVVEEGKSVRLKDVLIEAFGKEHQLWYPGMEVVADTGYMIAEKFFYPGDAWHVPPKKVDILALSIVGSWMKLGEAMDYALKVKPKVAFPVHDGLLKIKTPFHKNTEKILPNHGIEYKILEEGKEYEF